MIDLRTAPVLYFLPVLFLSGASFVSSFSRIQGLPPYEKPPLASKAAQDMGAVLMGLRRSGADLALIQLLQYVVTPVQELDPLEKPDKTYQFTLRMIDLDPYFHFAHLLGSGLLAFHLEKYDEALDVLRIGMERDPTFWRYRLYAGGIAYKRSDQIPKVIELLEEAMRYPDCPTMLQNMLANLHTKSGNYKRAAQIYAHIIETSRDDDYVEKAKRKLERLLAFFNGSVPREQLDLINE